MILFAAGGTGGHLFPALAVAEQLRQLSPELPIAFVGTSDHLEADLVPAAGFAFHAIPARALPREFGWESWQFVKTTLRGVHQAQRLLRRLQPRAVLGCGAYVSFPTLIAAKLCRIPTLIAEANAYPGLANRALGSLVDRIFVAIPGTEHYFPSGKATCTGNPIRGAFGRLQRSEARQAINFPPTEQLLLVTGGSLGARSLNEAFSSVYEQVLERPDWSILHITGTKELSAIVKQLAAQPLANDPVSYETCDGRYRLLGFCGQMPEAIMAADLVLARSGATTTAELAAAGRPAVFIPLTINPDQIANAQHMERHGAGKVILNDRACSDLPAVLLPLLDDLPTLATMAAAAKLQGRPEAAVLIAREILSRIGSR
ncbi:MAG: undecaprenyldiphospho-muramoylpentapeptide beta-N-acetylglucosaminyltransferase [Cyanobacteria bacterium NC_groundwater_1444_Ag_S-0.65um_54_12]|nr:undecaprenyldiphospho-muramoylpentapeptide beta-N-acetylglucosaminyltransferase [Cyanobacteria bacterium NC_groundwater_1444_Ag_S-0.65um_54_12]